MEEKIEISSDFVDKLFDDLMIKLCVSLAPTETQSQTNAILKAFVRHGVKVTTAIEIMRDIMDELGGDNDGH